MSRLAERRTSPDAGFLFPAALFGAILLFGLITGTLPYLKVPLRTSEIVHRLANPVQYWTLVVIDATAVSFCLVLAFFRLPWLTRWNIWKAVGMLILGAFLLVLAILAYILST